MSQPPRKGPPDRRRRPAPSPAQQRNEIRRDRARAQNGRRQKRRRKKKSLGFWLVLLVLLLGITGCTLLTLWCKAETIQVAGFTRYEPAVVLQSCGIRQGDSLLWMNGKKISQKASETLPYVKEIILHRTLPSDVIVEVVEATPFRAFVTESQIFLCDEAGKILEKTDQVPSDVPLVLGNTLAGEAGQQIRWENEEQRDRFEEIDRLLTETEVSGISRWDLRNEVGVILYYQDSVKMEFGSMANFEYKLRFAKEYLEKHYAAGQTGALDLSMISAENRKIYFRQHDLSGDLADTGFVPAESSPEEPIPPEESASEGEPGSSETPAESS